MLEELLALGFDTVELGHGIRVSLMPGIEKVYREGRVRFSSLHNFCPLPVEITRAAPDCFVFTSPRKEERERAIKLTRQTIDFAARLGAPRVVLHGGRVTMKPITRRLIAMATAGQHLSPPYAKAKREAVMEREAAAPVYLQRLHEALEVILPYAEERGVKLGMEGRHSYEEMPSEREFGPLLEAFPALGYWHDFGHLQVKENLGFVDHAEWLSTVAPRLIGCHLHDVRWPGEDHRAPFTGGGVRYDRLVPLLPRETLWVWEMSTARSGEEISHSLQQWKERFGV